jgi:aminoglycoside 6'-N-acetyltransferase
VTSAPPPSPSSPSPADPVAAARGLPSPQDPDVGFVALHTERLTIRRFRREDAPALAAYRSEPVVARYQGWDTPFTEEQAEAFIAELEGSHPDTPDEWFQLAVSETASGVLVGDVGVGPDGDDPRLARIGFTVAPAHQGQGLATEAVTAVLDHLFRVRGKHRVAADCDVRNTASVALLERVGMRREAHHLASAWWKGEWTDEYVYAVLADEWLAR